MTSQGRISTRRYSLFTSPAAVGAFGGLATAFSTIIAANFIERESTFAYCALAGGLILIARIALIFLVLKFVNSKYNLKLKDTSSFKEEIVFGLSFITVVFLICFGEFLLFDTNVVFGLNFLILIIGYITFSNSDRLVSGNDSNHSET